MFRYVFKEFELQQKLQEMTQKHRNLKEDYDSLKHGNYQVNLINLVNLYQCWAQQNYCKSTY